MTDEDTLARIEAYMSRGDELLARIDEHLERGIQDSPPEHLARGAEFAARIEEHLSSRDEVIVENKRAFDDLRFSMRQDSLRNEKAIGEMSQALARHSRAVDRHSQVVDRHSQVVERHSRVLTSRTDEIIAEGKAQRAALWKLLDRLPGPDGPAPAAG